MARSISMDYLSGLVRKNMDSQQYYNLLHNLKDQINKQLKQGMTQYNYVNVAIHKTRLAVLEETIKSVAKQLAAYEPFLPDKPTNILLLEGSVDAKSLTLAQFIIQVITQCAQLEYYWMYYSDTPEGAKQYDRVSKLMNREATIEEYVNSLNTLLE